MSLSELIRFGKSGAAKNKKPRTKNCGNCARWRGAYSTEIDRQGYCSRHRCKTWSSGDCNSWLGKATLAANGVK